MEDKGCALVFADDFLGIFDLIFAGEIENQIAEIERNRKVIG